MSIPALLHRAALAGVTIYHDDVQKGVVVWPVSTTDPALMAELTAHSEEIVAFLRDAQFFGCCCPECRTTVH
jgi:hypothetical protein